MTNERLCEVIDDTQRVFDHWVSTSWSGRGVKPRLTDKRKKIIRKAISEYGCDVCIAAVDGNASSDWHQGRNQRNKKYNSIELILRDAEHIENFANMILEDPKKKFLDD